MTSHVNKLFKLVCEEKFLLKGGDLTGASDFPRHIRRLTNEQEKAVNTLSPMITHLHSV